MNRLLFLLSLLAFAGAAVCESNIPPRRPRTGSPSDTADQIFTPTRPARATPPPEPSRFPPTRPTDNAKQLFATPYSARTTYSKGRVNGPWIAMTFDDGPHVDNTPRLLDMLKERGIKATFFVVGSRVAENPAIVRRIVAEGHEVGNHTWSHPDITKLDESAVADEIRRTHELIIRTTGVTPKLFRPPYGEITASQTAWISRTWAYKSILWNVDPLDWKIRNAEHVQAVILRDTVSGSIIISHDIHKSTVDAMPGTLDGLLAKGFKFATVSELLAMERAGAPNPKAAPAPR